MKKVLLLASAILFIWQSYVDAGEEDKMPLPREARLTPKEAYEAVMKEPEHAFLLDCRSMAEYEFAGHPPMAYNIPFKFWSPKGLASNPDFAEDVAERFKKSDTLILLCTYGKRSESARAALKERGFENLFTVTGGFEGQKIKDKDNPAYGLRGFVNGWRYEGLPYTYKLEKGLTYKTHTSCGCE